MKKAFAILISLVLLFSLAACSGRAPSPSTGTDSPAVGFEDNITVKLTFPEGFTLIEIAERLEENKVCSAKEFMALATDKAYLSTLEYGILDGIEDVENVAYYLEGLVFPDTYDFYVGESAEKALSRFLKNTDTRITDEHTARAAELGYSIREILTIASIIQEEASDPDEMPNVSSVLHNRLSNSAATGGKLQCDVTVHYLKNRIEGSPYLKGDATLFTQYYDTYFRKGLPTGPICNPGLAAIEAALYPADTDYYFFVTDSDWNYYYAETFSEHQKNCRDVGIYE